MKKIAKLIGILVGLYAVVLVGAYAYKMYDDYRFQQEQKEKEEDRQDALSRINYTIPDIFGVPSPGDRGYGYIDYNYEENGMVAQIILEVWNQEKNPAYSSVETVISKYGSREDETITEGPKDIDLNGLQAQTVVVESKTVSQEYGVHLSSRHDYFVFEKDGYLYILQYNIIDETMGDRENDQTNRCVTARDQFVNSIGDK